MQTFIFSVPAPYGQLNLNNENVEVITATDEAHADAILRARLSVRFNELHGYGVFQKKAA